MNINAYIEHSILPSAAAIAYGRPSTMNEGEHAHFVLRNGRLGLQSQAVVSRLSSLRDCWLELEMDFNSTCIGLVCRAGLDGTILLSLIAEAFCGAAMPGAIVVLGSDLALMTGLIELANAHPRPHMMRTISGASIPFEWTPIMIVAEASDPVLMETLRISRTLNELGVPVEATVVPELARFSGVDVPENVQAFLRRYLVENFPKMI